MKRSAAETDRVTQESAEAMLSATVSFLMSNKMPKRFLCEATRRCFSKRNLQHFPLYSRAVREYEEMGIVLSTWFTSKKFLDEGCRPRPISIGRSSCSMNALIRASKVTISAEKAVALCRRSPSVTVDASGYIRPQRREFVLPNFEVARAALVLGRYLDTLNRNSSKKSRDSVLLLERNCHVPTLDRRAIMPVLRDIKGRGAAFLNSVNGEIEDKRRVTSSASSNVAALSVHVFAWTGTKPQKGKRRPSNKEL